MTRQSKRSVANQVTTPLLSLKQLLKNNHMRKFHSAFQVIYIYFYQPLIFHKIIYRGLPQV